MRHLSYNSTSTPAVILEDVPGNGGGVIAVTEVLALLSPPGRRNGTSGFCATWTGGAARTGPAWAVRTAGVASDGRSSDITSAGLGAPILAEHVFHLFLAVGRKIRDTEAAQREHKWLRDEIGAMAAAVQVFKDNLIRARALEEETRAARAGAEAKALLTEHR